MDTDMDKQRLMIVDDEEDLREILQFNLENAGYEVVPMSSGEEALQHFDDSIDLILLDIMMEGISGFKVAEKIRKEKKSPVPIIFLTARSAENDVLTGFSTGGDDYIGKPFSINEVIARIKAVLKRHSMQPKQDSGNGIIHLGRLIINIERKSVSIDGADAVFSKKEFEIVSLLASHPGRIYSREEIINELWSDSPYILDRTVDVHIARIRNKLGPLKKYLTNKSGYGYSIDVAE